MLIESSMRELCLISTPYYLPRIRQLLGDGGPWGLSIEYREQAELAGIVEAFIISENFIGQDAVTVILGDNIFYGGDTFHRAFAETKSGAIILAFMSAIRSVTSGAYELLSTNLLARETT